MDIRNNRSANKPGEHLQIANALLRIHRFSEDQLDQFMHRISLQRLLKNQLLLKPNQVSQSLTFINSGSFRIYRVTEHGELTINFFTENEWVADIESFLSQKPGRNYIEAFENSSIASITLKDIHDLMDIHPSFKMLNSLMAKWVITTDHLAAISTKNPRERYAELLMKHPDWIIRFPQKQLASYLGITPETLSRVRRRVS